MTAMMTVLLDLNTAREDRRVILRDLTTMEATMESIVSTGIAKALGSLRADFKKLLDHMSEGTPQPRQEEFRRGQGQAPEGELGSARIQPHPSTWRQTTGGERVKGVIGGGLVREDPIGIDTPESGRESEGKEETREDPVRLDIPKGSKKDPVMPRSSDIDLSQERSVTSYNPTPTPTPTLSPLTLRDSRAD